MIKQHLLGWYKDVPRQNFCVDRGFFFGENVIIRFVGGVTSPLSDAPHTQSQGNTTEISESIQLVVF